jgi:hypothetical protein
MSKKFIVTRKLLTPLILLMFGIATPSSAQISGTMELNLTLEGQQWKAEAKFNAVEARVSSSLQNLKIRETEIEFATTMLEAELRFSGRVTNGNLSGTIGGFQGGLKIAAGTWSLTRQQASNSGLAGRWVGSFMVQPGGQPQTLQTGVDLGFTTNVSRPAYTARHPKVLFDEAHNNADKSSGRYKPFADLITSDGYTVVPNTAGFSKSALAGVEVLAVVNASGPPEQRGSSAFSKEECEVVRAWVNAGGALLLITDHSPFSEAVADLSKLFDVDLTKGYTIDAFHHNTESEDTTELIFTRENGLLMDHPITRGRDASEQVNRIITFSGTSLKGPPGSVSFLKLADTAMDILPPAHKPASPDEPAPDHRQVSAAGRAQGAALSFGKGRVVVLGEAAMLTAQVAPRGFRFGMNLPGIDNRQLALNIMHWLSGLLK